MFQSNRRCLQGKDELWFACSPRTWSACWGPDWPPLFSGLLPVHPEWQVEACRPLTWWNKHLLLVFELYFPVGSPADCFDLIKNFLTWGNPKGRNHTDLNPASVVATPAHGWLSCSQLCRQIPRQGVADSCSCSDRHSELICFASIVANFPWQIGTFSGKIPNFHQNYVLCASSHQMVRW